MPPSFSLSQVGRLPAPDDNVAIAVRRLDPGMHINLPNGVVTLQHTVLEGHRFAIAPIAVDGALLSWGLPFGHARTVISPGDYVCNASTLAALAVRQRSIQLPTQPNFTDHLEPFALDAETFQSAAPTPQAPSKRSFRGFRRPGGRGVGTRNTIVILGTSSRTASFARQLAQRLQPLVKVSPGIDDIVAVAHTEGGGPTEPNNAREVLRALAGFIVHPNVAAVLAVDGGHEPIANSRLREFLRQNHYPLEHVLHEFLSINHGVPQALAAGEATVKSWVPQVTALSRTPEPLGELRIALQCGGSDAFSGVSGNPLAGAMVHEIVREGGIGVLCETDEVNGGEAHLMRNIRDQSTAEALLHRIAQFKERMSWHGVSPEANPSAGNKYRGLYNIALKSLGAVQKKDPHTRVDHVTDYAEPLDAPGFYFMDSPGNDLEAIAGQVAAGCNLVLFVTGNGSITNFPFVPTLKITTTTRRHQLLEREMDINAGRYLDGESFQSLTDDALDLLIRTASGERSKGEQAGHYQTSLWRNWQQTDAQQLTAIEARVKPTGSPLPLDFAVSAKPAAVVQTEAVGLVIPTSLCSSQIARMATERMNEKGLAGELGISRFVTLPHSEGCGFGGDEMERSLHRAYRGYATHPNVAAALLLEHGCEKVPNDAMRRQFEAYDIPLDRFGWASVQLDGGIDRTLAKIEAWFREHAVGVSARETAPLSADAIPSGINLGLLSTSPPTAAIAVGLSRLARAVLESGGSVAVPEGDALLQASAFTEPLVGNAVATATLANAEVIAKPGFQVVRTETDHWSENLTSLSASGLHVIVGWVGPNPQSGHPLVPVLQLADETAPAAEVDLAFGETEDADLDQKLAALINQTLAGSHQPAAQAMGMVDFQFTRGLLGVSA